jgi:hypothetical protein
MRCGASKGSPLREDLEGKYIFGAAALQPFPRHVAGHPGTTAQALRLGNVLKEAGVPVTVFGSSVLAGRLLFGRKMGHSANRRPPTSGGLAPVLRLWRYG